MARIVVIGGGISGLSLMHYLQRFSRMAKKNIQQVVLLESDKRIGGCIETKKHDDGVIHELGPRSIRFMNGQAPKNTLCLASEIGLDNDLALVDVSNPATKNRYLYYGDQLEKIPNDLLSLFRKLPGCNDRLYQILSKDIKTPKINIKEFPHEDPSIHNFFTHRLGENASSALFDPLLRGITAGNFRKLSVRSNFPAFFNSEQQHGSVIKGAYKGNPVVIDELLSEDVSKTASVKRVLDKKVKTYSFKGGLQTLTERLCDSILTGNSPDTIWKIHNQSPVERITYLPNKEWSIDIQTLNGDIINMRADHIFAALPSNYLADILNVDTNSQDTLRSIRNNLKDIPFAPVACVCLEYRDIGRLLHEETQSFGFLTHSNSKSKVLGITFDSTALPEHDNGEGKFRMTAMIGGAWFEEILGTNDVDSVPDKKYIRIALDEIKKILLISEEPYRVTVKVWKDGIAQYIVGHNNRVESIRKDIERLSLPLTVLGQSYDGVSINDVIYSSRTKANQFINSLT